MPIGDDSAGTSLVVLAPPEPSSFAAALAHTATDSLTDAGWAVTLLDLYGEGFDPVLSERDFTERAIPERLQPMDEQAHAAAGARSRPASPGTSSSSSRPTCCSRLADVVVLGAGDAQGLDRPRVRERRGLSLPRCAGVVGVPGVEAGDARHDLVL